MFSAHDLLSLIYLKKSFFYIAALGKILFQIRRNITCYKSDNSRGNEDNNPVVVILVEYNVDKSAYVKPWFYRVVEKAFYTNSVE